MQQQKLAQVELKNKMQQHGWELWKQKTENSASSGETSHGWTHYLSNEKMQLTLKWKFQTLVTPVLGKLIAQVPVSAVAPGHTYPFRTLTNGNSFQIFTISHWMLKILLHSWKTTWDVNVVISASETPSILQICTPSLQVSRCAHTYTRVTNDTYTLQYVGASTRLKAFLGNRRIKTSWMLQYC